jgi:plasmid maintenance system antidote protein VapI
MILFVDSKRPASPSARAESLRALVRALVAKDFDGNQQAAATALGVTRATVNQLINGHKGPGQQIADGLVAYLRKSIDDLVAANGDLEALRRAPAAQPAMVAEVCFGALPGWPSLLEGARTIAPTIPEWCWQELASTRVWTRTPINSAMCAEMASFILRHFPPPSS